MKDYFYFFREKCLSSRLCKILLLAFLYVLSARLAIRLAVPPGHVSALWPPVGISLAFVLAYGWRVWPGIFIGEFVHLYVNTQNGLNLAEQELRHLFLPVLAAAGSVGHAFICRFLIEKYIGLKKLFHNAKNVALFLLLCGPICCLLTASIGAGSMWIDGKFSDAALPYNWFTWWVGDTLGVIIFAPIVYLLLQKHGEKNYRRVAVVGLPMLFAGTLSLSLYLHISDIEQKKIDTHFRNQTRRVAENLQNQFKKHSNVLRSIRNFYKSSPKFDRAAFSEFTREELRSDPSLLSIGLIKRVSKEETDKFQKNMAETNGYTEFFVKMWDYQGNLVPATRKDWHYPLVFYEPTEDRDYLKKMAGFDFSSEPLRFEALKKSCLRGSATMTPSLNIFSNKNGVVIFLPIFKKGYESSLALSCEHADAFAVGVVEIEQIAMMAFESADLEEVGLSLYEKSLGQDSEQKIFSMAAKNGEESPEGTLSWSKQVFLGGQEWVVRSVQSPSYLSANRSWQTWLVMAGGLLFTGFLGAIFLIVTGSNIRTEHLVQERTKELIQRNKELKKLSQVKSAFVANMSHEIRTPLHGIVGMSQLLLQSIKKQGNIKKVKVIQGCCETLSCIINDILDFSKLEAGKIVLNKTAFSPIASVGDVVELFRVTAEEKNIDLRLKVSGGRETLVKNDEVRFRQIMMNLIGNAVKFTDRGFIEVLVDVKEISESQQAQILVSVVDTGCGIPESSHHLIFKSFSQVDASPSKSTGGTGLGLAISRNLSHLMGGDIGFESQRGIGSRFFVRLTSPMVRSLRVERKNSSHKRDVDVDRIHPEDIKVLLVEDNSINRYVAEKMLQTLGVQSSMAKNGLEALRVLEKEKFDIIFMDCHMPEMDGFEATRKIKKIYGEASPKIIAISASAMAEEKDRCFEAGMEDFIAKPMKIEDLEKTLKKFAPGGKKRSFKVSTQARHSQRSAEKFEMKFLEDLIRLFPTESHKSLHSLTEALKNEDYKAVKFHAHSFKGAVSLFKLPNLTEELSELEKLADYTDHGAVHQKLENIELITEKINKDLDKERVRLNIV